MNPTASFRVIRHVHPKLACGCCDAIVLAQVLVAKFADHIPLCRQSLIYTLEGVELERALLVNWVGAASALLRLRADSGTGAGQW